MDSQTVLPLLLTSTVISAVAGHIFGRKKVHADVTAVHVDTALKLEEIAVVRYRSAQEALDAAQAALNAARAEIRWQEDYIELLHDLLDRAGIPYPPKEPAMYPACN